MVAEFRRRRDVIVEGLNGIEGITCTEPAGAFYVFPNITSFGLPSDDVAAFLLREAGVAGVSGTAFGRGGRGHLRFSYANSVEAIREARGSVSATLPGLVARKAVAG
jgi:aspartate aminotransferase